MIFNSSWQMYVAGSPCHTGPGNRIDVATSYKVEDRMRTFLAVVLFCLFATVTHAAGAIVKSGVRGSGGMIRRPALEEPVCFQSPECRP